MKKSKYIFNTDKSKVQKFRQAFFKKGYELINVTSLLVPKMGCGGWCNGFNESDETIHHIQLWYRDEVVANIEGNNVVIIDEDRFLFYFDKEAEGFIIFMKKKMDKKIGRILLYS